MGAVENRSRDRSDKVEWEAQIITNVSPVKGVGSRRAVMLIVWNMHESCLKNVPSRKIEIECAGVMK